MFTVRLTLPLNPKYNKIRVRQTITLDNIIFYSHITFLFEIRNIRPLGVQHSKFVLLTVISKH